MGSMLRSAIMDYADESTVLLAELALLEPRSLLFHSRTPSIDQPAEHLYTPSSYLVYVIVVLNLFVYVAIYASAKVTLNASPKSSSLPTILKPMLTSWYLSLGRLQCTTGGKFFKCSRLKLN